MRDFYALIIRLKEEIDLRGAEITFDQVQGALISFMDQHLQVHDEVMADLYEEMKFIMIALADEVFVNVRGDWPGRSIWVHNPLELQIYKSRNAGGKFYENIDNILSQRDKTKEDIAVAYLVALLLGFQGQAREVKDEKDKPRRYRDRLENFVGIRSVDGDSSEKPLFPDAYAHTITKPPTDQMPDARKYIRWLILVVIMYFSLSHVAWYFQTDEIRSVIYEVTNKSGSQE